MKILIVILGWAALSVGYWFLAFVSVANLFGREGNGNHLAGLAVAFAAWVTLTLLAVRALRASKPMETPQ